MRAAAVVPETLGEFAVEHELGRGGSGVVYAARWGAQEIALKVLREDDAASARERDRFLAEARHLARVTHPGVVRVLAVGALPDGRPYLAMERLRGTTIAERVMMQRMTVQESLLHFEQLTAAVAALHAAGLVHRDIKPENIMLVGERLVLLDFGIARGIDDLPSTTTQAGMQRGTPAYMAPERFFGARATVASDVYETAVVLYVMLTGALPWADPRAPKDRMSPRRPSEIGVAMPPALEDALMAALVADPAARPTTIEALVEAIRRGAWEGETQLAPASSDSGLRTQKVRTGRVLAGVGLAAAFVGAVVVAMTLTRSATPTSGQPVAAVAEADAGAAGAGAGAAAGAAAAAAAGAAADADAAAAAGAGAGAAAAAGAAAGAGADAGAAPSKQRKKRPRSGTGTGTGTVAGTGRVSGSGLPACRDMAALYCTDDFKATEGGLAGQLCRAMTKNVADWEKLPAVALPDQEKFCRESYPQMAAAVAERIRQFKAGQGPPAP